MDMILNSLTLVLTAPEVLQYIKNIRSAYSPQILYSGQSQGDSGENR